jgi:hypothetical protein
MKLNEPRRFEERDRIGSQRSLMCGALLVSRARRLLSSPSLAPVTRPLIDTIQVDWLGGRG